MAADDERWIARGEAMARLGVKAQTLYAYVSRGRIAARPDPAGPRRSLYAATDIARLTRGDAGGEEVKAALFTLDAAANAGPVTLLYAAKNEERNNAVALREWLERR